MVTGSRNVLRGNNYHCTQINTYGFLFYTVPTAPLFTCRPIASIDSLVSACIEPMRSRIRSTAEPERKMRDNGVVLSSVIERCRVTRVAVTKTQCAKSVNTFKLF